MGLKDSVFDSRHFWRSDIFWFGAKWRSYGAIDVNRRRLLDCNISVVCSPTKKIHKTKVAQHGKVNFLVGFWRWYDHRFQFGRDCASLNEVWKSPPDSIFYSEQLLLNDFFGLTIHSILDDFTRNQSKVIFELCVVTLVNTFSILAQSDHWFKIWRNWTKFRENEMKFWLRLKWLSLTPRVQKSPRFWDPMKIQLFPTFAQATKNLEKKSIETARNPTDPQIWWPVIWIWIRLWFWIWTWLRFLGEAKPNHVWIMWQCWFRIFWPLVIQFPNKLIKQQRNLQWSYRLFHGFSMTRISHWSAKSWDQL